MTAVVAKPDAQLLEDAFLGGLEDAQNAYERIVAIQAWTSLGFDTFAAWWDERVRPAMTALSMRPTREIAAAVVEQVRAEEAVLPSAQRRTQRELAAMVGTSEATVGRLNGTRSTQASPVAGPDLETTPEPARQDIADAILRHIDDTATRRPEPIPAQTQAILDDIYRRIGPAHSIATGCELLLDQVRGIDPAEAIRDAPADLLPKLTIARAALDYLTRVVDALHPAEVPA